MRRWSTALASLTALVSVVLSAPGAGALPVEPAVPAEACTLLGTVTAVASGLQATAESTTGQDLPFELDSVLAGAIEDAGCGSAEGPDVPTSELCVLLSAASTLATTVERTVEGATATSLPVSPEGTARDLSREAGCSPSGAAPGGTDPVCAILETVRDAARTIQSVAESTAAQKLPVQLASVIGEVEAASGCGATGGTPTAAACDLLSTFAGAGNTVQATVESTSGQKLPVSLSATIEDAATEGGCVKAGSGAPGESKESSSEPTTTTTSTTIVSASGGSGGGGGGEAATVLGSSAQRDLPRTGPMLPARTSAAGIGLASLVSLVLARRLRPRSAA